MTFAAFSRVVWNSAWALAPMLGACRGVSWHEGWSVEDLSGKCVAVIPRTEDPRGGLLAICDDGEATRVLSVIPGESFRGGALKIAGKALDWQFDRAGGRLFLLTGEGDRGAITTIAWRGDTVKAALQAESGTGPLSRAFEHQPLGFCALLGASRAGEGAPGALLAFAEALDLTSPADDGAPRTVALPLRLSPPPRWSRVKALAAPTDDSRALAWALVGATLLEVPRAIDRALTDWRRATLDDAPQAEAVALFRRGRRLYAFATPDSGFAGFLAAVDPETMRRLWRFDAGGHPDFVLDAGGDRRPMIVMGVRGQVIAVDAQGQVLWEIGRGGALATANDDGDVWIIGDREAELVLAATGASKTRLALPTEPGTVRFAACVRVPAPESSGDPSPVDGLLLGAENWRPDDKTGALRLVGSVHFLPVNTARETAR